MKSSQLQFANPRLNDIDFEIVPNSPGDQLVGMICLAGIIVTVVGFLLIASALPLNSGNIGSLLTPLMIYIVLKLLRAARKYLQNSMSLVQDQRAPIVYLRSFSDDYEDDDKRWDKKTSEELIATALKYVGPVLAVKDPRQHNKVLGATRIIMGKNWREEMAKLISISRVVIVEANYTDSLLWELELIKRSSRPEQLIISFLSRDEYPDKDASIGQLMDQGRPAKSHYEKFDNAFAQIFGVSLQPYNSQRLCFFYFDDAWRPKPVTLQLAPTPFRRLSLLILTPFVFSKRFKVHLPFWKIKRALLLILHHNGIVAQPEYEKEIAEEGRRIELALNDPDRNRDATPQFGAGVLGLVGRDTEAIETEPARSLLQEIDSYRPNRRLFIALGVAAGLVVVINLVSIFGVDLSSAPARSHLENGLLCLALRAPCAIDSCTRAIEADPGNAKAYRCLGDAFFFNQNYRQAIGQYDKAIELEPYSGETYYNRGASYFNLQNYDRAISDLELAKERDRNNALYLELSGRAYLAKQDYENAVRDLRRAVQLDGRNASRFYYLSIAHEALGEHEEAILSITSAIVLNSNAHSYYSFRGLMYFSRKQYDESISDYDQAILLGSELLELFYNRGLAYCLRKSRSKKEDYRRAVEDFSKVIELDDSYRNAYRNRAFAHSKLGMVRQTQSDLEAYERLGKE